jgi:Meiotically up-regulated gene 113
VATDLFEPMLDDAKATRESLERTFEQCRDWLAEIAISQSVSPAAPERERHALRHCRFVYLMRSDNGEYKIGESRLPRKRRKQVQRQERRRVDLITQYPSVVAPRLERALHRHFRHVHVRDEWFNLPESVTTPIVGFWVIAALLEEHVLELESWRLHEVIKHLRAKI